MKALSLKQPWASLLAGGEKRVETRAWKTQERGRIAIHASKGFEDFERDLVITSPFVVSMIRLGFNRADDLPLGAIIGVGTLRDMWPAQTIKRTLNDKELAFGNYEMGRWAWVFADLCMFKKPIPCRGMPGLWPVPESVLPLIELQRSQS